jgi:hypothetical protein
MLVRIMMQKLEPGAVIRATREQTRDHTGATGRRDAQAWCRQVVIDIPPCNPTIGSPP